MTSQAAVDALVPDRLPKSSQQKLSVVTVTYNSARVLGRLLDSVEVGLDGVIDFEVVVVDNASDDDTVAVARAHPLELRIIESRRNGGYAAGINAAADTIAADRTILVLNPDIRLMQGSAASLVARLSDDSRVGIAVPVMAEENGALSYSLRREPSLATAWTEALLGGSLATRLGISEVIGPSPLYQVGGCVEWATGAALAIAPKARAAVGDWDESFFLYSEEVDYMRRVRAAGLRVECVPAARVVHVGGEREENPRLFSLMAANRIRDYGRRHSLISTTLFRAAVICGEALRSPRGRGHRAALRAALLARSAD
ncbi:glycosyltransferase family 2 protein [uncultured Paracoccus sp.]|uniref:glycosyltransferase family 2 protein n=1 Tax=uncultured Paracoccus sp. TaxID=189685 RepID=UPI002623CD47|nr:glycosyltransferase family 2 protein [uncultured Paracoccus sp.]